MPYNGGWQLLVNGEQAGIQTITTMIGDTITVPAVCSYVLKYNKNTIVDNNQSNQTISSDFAKYRNEVLEEIHPHEFIEEVTNPVAQYPTNKLIIDDQLQDMIEKLKDEQKIALYMFLMSLRK